MRQFIIISTFAVIILGAFLLTGFLSKQKEEPPKPEIKKAKKYVKTETVRYASIPTEVIASGRVKSAQPLDLIAEVSGRMQGGNIQLKEGQKFRKGDLIAQIDDTEASLSLQARKSNFLRDLAAVLPDFKIDEDFQGVYKKWENYFRSIDLDKSLPKIPDYETDKEKIFLATKNIFSSYYEIKSAEENLRKYNIYAPFNGAISDVMLQSGSFVNPGSQIAKIIRTDKLELEVAVEANDIPWIENGAQVMLYTEDQRQLKGTIIRISEYVNPNTQSIDVFIAIKPDKNRIFDGMYLKAVIPGKMVEKGMVIPRNAIFNSNQIYVVEDTVLKVKDIDIHKKNPETAVFSGLNEGEDLVTEPLINAYNTMRVWKLSEKNDESDQTSEQGQQEESL